MLLSRFDFIDSVVVAKRADLSAYARQKYDQGFSSRLVYVERMKFAAVIYTPHIRRLSPYNMIDNTMENYYIALAF